MIDIDTRNFFHLQYYHERSWHRFAYTDDFYDKQYVQVAIYWSLDIIVYIHTVNAEHEDIIPLIP